jgi:hypothetical protein
LILVLYMNTFIVAGIIINLKKIKKRKIWEKFTTGKTKTRVERDFNSVL